MDMPNVANNPTSQFNPERTHLTLTMQQVSQVRKAIRLRKSDSTYVLLLDCRHYQCSTFETVPTEVICREEHPKTRGPQRRDGYKRRETTEA